MFQTNKNSYRITAWCSDGEHEGTYTFIEGPDDDWSEIASQMFYDEFGVRPNHTRKVSSEQL